MKDVINLIITIALIFFAIGLTSVIIKLPDAKFGALYFPLLILYILWGLHLNEKY